MAFTFERWVGDEEVQQPIAARDWVAHPPR
jgi:hypothetical protein